MPKKIVQRQSQKITFDDDDEPPRRRRKRPSRSQLIIVMVIYFGAFVLAWNLLPTVGIIDNAERAISSLAIGFVAALVARKLLP